jgi:bla regulator protein BlaR1
LCDEKGENGVASNQRAWWLFTVWVAFGLGQLSGQILHATGPLPAFEVATIKPSNDDNAIPSLSTPTESRTINVTARNLIEQAYGIPWTPGRNERVVGGPGWIDNNRYDVDARIDQSLVARFEKLSHEERKEQMSLMMQSLLADRFKLEVHVESVELPIYALLFAKGGPKLTVAKDVPATTEEDQTPARVVFPMRAEDVRKGFLVLYRGQAAEMTAKATTLDELVHWLAGYSEIGGRTVVNRTELTERYDFTLRWTRERLIAQGPQDGQLRSAPSNVPEAPSLFTALQEQLGLRLMSTKGPVDVLVIDHIDPPSQN